MEIPIIDWKIGAVIVMLALGIYNVSMRKFFDDGGDWKLFLPLAAIAGVGALVLLAFTYKEINFDSATYPMLALSLVTISLVTLFSMMVFSHPEVQLSIAVPVMALSTVVSVLLAMMFLGEAITLQKGAGIILAIIAIGLLSL